MAEDSRDKPLVVVTGASGLIGSALVEALLPRHRVAGLDLEWSEAVPQDVVTLECDLTKDADVTSALGKLRRSCGPRVASVVHLAAYYDFSGEPSPLYDELTVQGTRRLLESLHLQRFEVEQFVFSSSLLAMKASSNGEPIDESSPLEPTWDYPRSKIEAEKVIEQWRGAIPVVVLRIAGVYDDEGHSIPIVQQIRRIYEKKLESYLFPGNPENGQAFVHIDDVVTCFERVIEARHRLRPHEVFLVAEPEVMSYLDLQERIGVMLHGEEWPTIRIPPLVAKAGAWIKDKLPGESPFIKPWMVDLADANYPVSIARARERLDWEPRHRLRNTLDQMLNRLVEDPVGWYEANDLEPPPEVARK